MNMTELNKILEKHKKWFNEEPDGEREQTFIEQLLVEQT